MVFLAPPHLASASKPSYAQAYADILAAHRRSPLTSASSVILLVAPDVDALCAAKMLAEFFMQDDIMHRIIPVSGIAELENMKDELATYTEVWTAFFSYHASDVISYIPWSLSTWAPSSTCLRPYGLVISAPS